MCGHLSRGDVYFQARAGYSESTWSGREDCFRGSSCAAVPPPAAGGGAELCGFLPPQREAVASVQPPVIPAHWGQDFRGGRKGDGLLMCLKGACRGSPPEIVTPFPVLDLNQGFGLSLGCFAHISLSIIS